VIGVDVGIGSARACVPDLGGAMPGTAKQDIDIHRAHGDIVEQSSTQVWPAVCGAVRGATFTAGVDRGSVCGIGFDATCSLVIVGPEGRGLPVGDADHP